MQKCVIYIHGKGGSAAEAAHYKPLFPNCAVFGLDYHASAPWEAGREIRDAILDLAPCFDRATLIANSVGAFFSMCAGIDTRIRKAYFISPIVDMEKLICEMMRLANVSEEELEAKGVVQTALGEDLSWEYLRYVRTHPVRWNAPTEILYAGGDTLTTRETITSFADAHNASLTIMENGEHWFHTQEQTAFLDAWLRACEAAG